MQQPVGLGQPPQTMEAAQHTSTVINCPQNVVGRVIGRGGETIKNLQLRSGCHIQIDQNYPEGMPRKITVSGSILQVPQAVAMVNQKINDHGPSTGGTTQTIDCPKNLVGRVIGRGGETINDLQQRSGARIQILQDVPEGTPCKVTINGTPQTVEVALKLVNDVIQHGPNHTNQPAFQATAGAYTAASMHAQPGAAAYMQPAAYGHYAQQGYPHQAYAAYGQYGQPAAASYPYQYPQQYSGYPADATQQQAQQAYASQQQGAGAPAANGGSADWQEHKDQNGTSYWYNSITGQSQWEKPETQ